MQYLVIRDPPEWLLRHPQLCSLYSTFLLEWADMKLWWRDPTTASWLDGPADWTRTGKKKGRALVRDGTDDDDFSGLLEKVEWSPSSSSSRPLSSADSASDSGSLSDPRSERLSGAWSASPTLCSRMAYARYLPCACSNCRDKEAEVVVYLSEQDRMLTRNWMRLLPVIPVICNAEGMLAKSWKSSNGGAMKGSVFRRCSYPTSDNICQNRTQLHPPIPTLIQNNFHLHLPPRIKRILLQRLRPTRPSPQPMMIPIQM